MGGVGGEGEGETIGAGCGVVVEPDEEEDCGGDVDEGVYAIGPVHKERVGEEPVLDGEFVEEVESLLEAD